jgi:hypothetical protein
VRIGLIPEGTTDKALLEGLRERWCVGAQTVVIAYRGTRCKRRDYPKICEDARLKGVDVLVILTDSNNRTWHEVRDEERAAVPQALPLEVLIGVCERNVECWICADADHVAKAAQCDPFRLRATDPKGPFQSALGVSKYDTQEDRIREIVTGAPLKTWISVSPSFRAFYKDARALANRLLCAIPDEE